MNAVSIRLHDLIVIFLVGSKSNDVHSQPNQLSGLCVGPNQIVHTTIPNPIDHITIILLIDCDQFSLNCNPNVSNGNPFSRYLDGGYFVKFIADVVNSGNAHHYPCYAYVEYDQSHISDGANAHAN